MPNVWPGEDVAASRGSIFRRLVVLAVLITLFLIPFGAWVRLTDAGLGCPDWPGCYGKLSPEHAATEIARAVTDQGGEHGPVSLGKAWREMAHRYVASALGFLLLIIAFLALRWRVALRQSPWLAVAIVGVVIMQGLFGKWTVTLLLKPAIVTGHLLGGMTLLALLTWLLVRQFGLANAARRWVPVDPEPLAALRTGARIGLFLLALQIALGGWVSTNYAALACRDLPTCQGVWLPAMNFSDGFHLLRELGRTAEGAGLSASALTAIHWIHRVGAVVLGLWLLGLAVATIRSGAPRIGMALAVALALQVVLGISNVVFGLPLPVAVAHNAGAAVLLTVLLALNFKVTLAAQRV
jgi:cytochrome c oxidase assembly protein subunit 15